MNNYELPVTHFKPNNKGAGDFLTQETAVVQAGDNLKMKNESILTVDELSTICLRADLRRRSHKLKMDLSSLQQASPLESAKAAYAGNIQKVNREASGEEKINLPAAEAAERIEELEDKIKKQELFPNLAALYSAEIVKLRLSRGDNPDSAIEQTKKYLEAGKNLPKTTPASLLPDAMLLGAQKQLAKKLTLPAKEKITQAIRLSDKTLLADYALALPEHERQEFLDLIPESQRKKISAIMDSSLSEVLVPSDLPKLGELPISEGLQYGNIQERVKSALTDIVRQPDLEPSLVSTIKILSETLGKLGDEGSKRLLQTIGTGGLRAEKNQDKNMANLSYTARIIRTLWQMDKNLGGNLALKFLGKAEIPDKLFTYFTRSLIASGFLTKNANDYLEEKNNWPFLRKLIAQYPNQFNTTVDTISQIEDYAPAKNQEEIFSALEDLESLTPIVFKRYRQADAVGKKELGRRLKELKPAFFKNVPIKDSLPRQDQEILAEMVYLAYKPINMSFEQVEKLISSLDDQTEDLEKYQFPAEGYEFELSQQKSFQLKKGQRVDPGKLKNQLRYFSGNYPEAEKGIEEFSSILKWIAKAGTDLSSEQLRSIFGLMARDEMILNFVKRHERLEENNSFNYLNELKEIVNVYFKDNYGDRLKNFFGANPSVEAEFMKLFSKNSNRKDILRKQLGKEGQDINWEAQPDKNWLAEIITRYIQEKVLKSLRFDVSRDINKFEEVEEGGEILSSVQTKLKAYISKNVGSFFAKASAGICTAGDIPLFQRKDHFHINIVEADERVRANIQAFIIKENGGQSLVLRGFNPNTDFLAQIDVKSFVEKIIKTAKQFQRDNGLKQIYITEDLGGWHALSNRAPVSDYLIKRYKKEKTKKPHKLQIASGTSVNFIYEV